MQYRHAVAPRQSNVVTKPATRTRRIRRTVSEEFIVATATTLFSRMGYPGVSIRDIAQACDANISSIYQHFKEKDDLYDRCCEHAFQGVSSRLRDTLIASEAPREQLLAFTTALCDILINSAEFRRLLQRELLLSRSARFTALTNRHFTHEYRSLIPLVAHFSSSKGARARTFSIYAMVFGLIALQPISKIARAGASIQRDPASLARFVLASVLPGHLW